MDLDFEQLDELRRWMIDNSVLEVEVNGVHLRLAESAIPVEHPEVEGEDPADRPATPVTFESLRAAAARKPSRDA